MDLKGLASVVANFAPTLGAFVGGPIGGGVGSLIAAAFGTSEDPEAMVAAIKADPGAAVKLAQIEAHVQEHKITMGAQVQQAKLNAETLQAAEATKQMAEINHTIRAEYMVATTGAGTFKTGWRPFLGWTFGVSIAWLLGCVGYLMIESPEHVGGAVAGIASLQPLFITICAVLGVLIKKRSDDKVLAAGGGGLGEIGKAIASRVGR